MLLFKYVISKCVVLCSCIAQAYPELEQNDVWCKQYKKSLIGTLGKLIEIVAADFKACVNDMCVCVCVCVVREMLPGLEKAYRTTMG